MIDHTSISVSNYEKGKNFYQKLLGPLGYSLVMDLPEYKVCGFGVGDSRDFWVGEPLSGRPPSPSHIAFVANNESEVSAFYEAGIAFGGKDNGKPGPRPEYGQNYFASFIHDEDGNNIEAVFRG